MSDRENREQSTKNWIFPGACSLPKRDSIKLNKKPGSIRNEAEQAVGFFELAEMFGAKTAAICTILSSMRQTSMTKIEAIIQPARLEAVKDALIEKGVQGMTISDVRGHGRQKGHTEVYRGREYSVDLLPKIKIETVISDELVEGTVQAILAAAATGKIGDGKIFLSKVDDAIRIRNQERGAAAL
jgi:nitrogen regulatory protein P-II 1